MLGLQRQRHQNANDVHVEVHGPGNDRKTGVTVGVTHRTEEGGGAGLVRTGQTLRVCERSSRAKFQAKLKSSNRERASLTSVSRGVIPPPPRTVNRRRTAPNVKTEDNRGVKAVDTPVINERRLHGEEQEGHDGVADGELGGGPRHHVVAQLQASAPQEVVAEGFTDLACRGGGHGRSAGRVQ